MQRASLPVAGKSAVVTGGARGLGRKALVHRVDVTDVAQVQAMVDQTVTELGGLDILANCAGVINIRPVGDLAGKGWGFVMDVNAKGTFRGCKAALGPMRAR